jgi:hypothetical protein
VGKFLSPRQLVKLGQGIKDTATARAVRNLEAWAEDLAVALDKADVVAVVETTEPAAHTHTISDVSGLAAELASKSSLGHTHLKSEITDFAHTHPQSDITNLVSDLAGKIDGVTAGVNLSGGGTSGTVTLNVVDSPSFAGNVTLGDSTSDSHTINGHTTINAPDGAQGLTVTNATTGKTALLPIVASVLSSGTFNTAAGETINTALKPTANSTRASGANDLHNVGLYATGTNGDVNYGVVAEADGVGTPNHAVFAIADGGSANYSFFGAAGDLYNADDAVIGGTLNAVTGLQVNGTPVSTVTNSAGANVIPKSDGTNLVASSWTDNGTTSTTTGNVTIQQSPSGITPAPSQLVVDHSGGESIISLLNDTHLTRIAFGNSSGNQDGIIDYNSAGGRGMRFRTAGTYWTSISSTGTLTHTSHVNVQGNATLGSATSNAHTVNGRVTVAATGAVTTGFGSNTATGVAGNRSGWRHEMTGSNDATAADRENVSITGSVFASRSAGSNNVINTGGQFHAVNGQINRAIHATAGDVILNSTSGNTCIGTTTSPGTKLHVVGNASVTGSVAVGGATGPTWTAGTGSPEGVVTAPVGSLFSRTDGGAGTSFYVKESGTGNTGWVAK